MNEKKLISKYYLVARLYGDQVSYMTEDEPGMIGWSDNGSRFVKKKNAQEAAAKFPNDDEVEHVVVEETRKVLLNTVPSVTRPFTGKMRFPAWKWKPKDAV